QIARGGRREPGHRRRLAGLEHGQEVGTFGHGAALGVRGGGLATGNPRRTLSVHRRLTRRRGGFSSASRPEGPWPCFLDRACRRAPAARPASWSCCCMASAPTATI